jgi:hypothetical protein
MEKKNGSPQLYLKWPMQDGKWPIMKHIVSIEADNTF